MKILSIFICCGIALTGQLNGEGWDPGVIPRAWRAIFPIVELSLPKNYVGMPYGGNFENAEKILIGDKKDIENHLKNKKINKPIFHIELCSKIKQTGPNKFSGEHLISDRLKKLGMIDSNVHRLKWGKYPVTVFEGKFPGNIKTRYAWIGLNKEGMTLFVTIISPEADEDIGEPETQRVWRNFILKTKPTKFAE